MAIGSARAGAKRLAYQVGRAQGPEPPGVGVLNEPTVAGYVGWFGWLVPLVGYVGYVGYVGWLAVRSIDTQPPKQFDGKITGAIFRRSTGGLLRWIHHYMALIRWFVRLVLGTTVDAMDGSLVVGTRSYWLVLVLFWLAAVQRFGTHVLDPQPSDMMISCDHVDDGPHLEGTY